MVFYIDDPPGDSPLGIYAAPPVGGEVSLVSTSVSGEDLAPGDAPPELMGAFDRGDPAFRLPAAADGAPGSGRIPIEGSPPTQWAEAERPRAARLSPTARWLAYYLAFETEPARNGLWIVGTSGEAARQVPSFGSYRWGADERLLFIPFVPEARRLTLAAFDPATGTTEVVREAEAFPGGIAANDWSVSPDGWWVVYRSAADAALWIVPMSGE